ncbi:hypothetical protein Tco_0622067 [Tanacetum coccineum]
MGVENPICTLGDYSKPSHEGYRNTIKLPEGNNVAPLPSDTIWTYSKRSLIMALIFGSKSKSFMTMSILPQDEPSINRPVVSNLLPQEVRHRVNKISSSYEICSGPYDTQYCMENPKQAFVNYVSSRNDEVGGRFQKLDDTPTPDTAGNSMAHMNLASTGRIKK